MKRTGAPVSIVLVGIFAVAGGRSASGAQARCGEIAVECDAGVRARWPDLPDQVREAFAMRDEVDTCARVRLATAGTAILLEVHLPDGRTATRAVLRREDVVPALEALLLVPAEGVTPQGVAPAAVPASVPSSAVDTIAPSQITATLRTPQDRPSQPADGPSRFGVDLSIAVGARVGDGQVGAGVGLVSSLELVRWLIGFRGELDRNGAMAGGAQAMALELGVLGGRRVRFAASTLDIVAGPALALRGGESVTAPAGTGTGMASMSQMSSADPLPRLLGSARLSFGHSILRTFVELDGEVGRPQADSDLVIPGSPRLPLWTFGVAVGAAVGTR